MYVKLMGKKILQFYAVMFYILTCVLGKRIKLRGHDDTGISVVDTPINLSGHLIGNILEYTSRCLNGGHRLDGGTRDWRRFSLCTDVFTKLSHYPAFFPL